MKEISTKRIGLIIIIFSLIGLYVSFLLSIDKMELLTNPDAEFGCSISETISCKSVMESQQSAVLGFPNSFLGIMGYSFMLVTGFLIYKSQYKDKLYFRIFTIGMLTSYAFSTWLLYQSVYVIESLCPLCLLSYLSALTVAVVGIYFSLANDIYGKKYFKWKKDKQQIKTAFFSLVFFLYFATFAVLFVKYDVELVSLIDIQVYLP